MRVIKALWYRNLKTFARNRAQLIITLVMPFFFLYVFSAIFKVDGIEDPINYMLAGIVITDVFQTSLNIASSTITDIVSGFMKEVLVSPVKRRQIAIGQLLAATTISTLQGIIVLSIGLFMGLNFSSIWTPIASIFVMILVGLTFSALGLFLATLVKNSQTFQVIQMSITLPLVFLCGAYLPIAMLPDILQFVAYCNPMTYTTAFFRTVLLEQAGASTEILLVKQLAFKFGDFVVMPWMSMVVVIVFGIIFLGLATIVFSRVDFSKINRTKGSDDDLFAQ